MPQIKAAIKYMRVSAKKNLRNRMVKSNMRTTLKKYDSAIASGDAATINEMVRVSSSTVDRAATKGVIHKNAANRKKARIARAAFKATKS